MQISLLVLRCRDIEKSKSFYECLDMEFVKEKHGDGPEHYVHAQQHGPVIELYPARVDEPVDRTGLGFGVQLTWIKAETLKSRGFCPETLEQNKRYVVRDPDGRRIELNEVIPF